MNLESVTHASIASILGLLVSVAPLVMGIAFALRPSERRLALMRPLSLAGIFAAVCSLLIGLVNVLHGLTMRNPVDSESIRVGALGLSESLVPLFVASACLTVAWLCVAMGMRKHS